jgi:hypothetical protein
MEAPLRPKPRRQVGAVVMASRKDKHDGDRSTSRITRDPFPKKPPYWKELWGVDITPDEWKAFVFLAGYDRWVGTGVSQTRLIGLVPPPGGKPSYVRRKREIGFVKVSYLSGENEALGREALIRVLKKPLKRPLQVALIGLFAQDEYQPTETRKLVFRFRSKHARETTKDRAIADFIQQRIEKAPPHEKKMLKPHIKDAKGIFGGTEKAIYEALARDKKRHPQLHLPVTSDRDQT